MFLFYSIYYDRFIHSTTSTINLKYFLNRRFKKKKTRYTFLTSPKPSGHDEVFRFGKSSENQNIILCD